MLEKLVYEQVGFFQWNPLIDCKAENWLIPDLILVEVLNRFMKECKSITCF